MAWSRSKYKNIRTPCGYKHVHDSGVEAARCCYLHLTMRARPPVQICGGRIVEIVNQPTLDLCVNGVKVCAYRADFGIRLRYQDKSERVLYEDVKGMETDVFRIKRKLYDALNPTNRLRVVKRVGNRWIEG